MSTPDTNRPTQNSDFRVETLDGEVLLYHTGQTRTVYLNDTASLIWSLCDGVRSRDDIVNLLVETYPDAADEIGRDVDETLALFIEHGAITYA